MEIINFIANWNWVAITAVAALITAISSLVVAIISKRQLRFNRNDQFEEDDFIAKRRTAANVLKNPTNENESEIEPVLDFFETLGFLTRRKALDEEFVWNTFFYWVYGYYRLCKDIIARQRTKYPTRYQDLLWLKDILINFEKRKRGELDESEWDSFLEEESALKSIVCYISLHK